MSDGLAGLRPLLVATLHQDRRNLAPWVMIISILSASSILVYAWVITEASERQQLAATIGVNPAMALVFGRPDDLLTADGFNAWRAGTLGLFFAGLMAVLAVVRSSRALEDSGQAELLAASVVGRRTRLAVAVLVAWVASAALGVVTFTLTVLCGGGAGTSAVLAATFTCAGLVFAGVAAVAVQVGAQARTATSLAVAVLGMLFVVRGYVDARAAGDALEGAVWLTPFGWLQETRPAGDTRLWPLLPALALAIALVATALVLEGRRDLGGGLLQPRRGPARGGRSAGLWGLTWQLHRGSLAGWTLAFVVIGFLFGTLAASMGEVIAASPVMAQVLAAGAASQADLTTAFLATILQLVGIVASVLGVQVVMRVYAEESERRVEPLLAGSLSRPRYLAATVLTALAATGTSMLAAGVPLALVAAGSDPALEVGELVAQASVTVPAVWVLVGVAVAAVGVDPRRRIVGWLAVVATFALTILGPTFRLWDWVLDISPLRHVPTVAGRSAGPLVGSAGSDWAPLVGLLLVAAAFTAVGFVGFRRRDLDVD